MTPRTALAPALLSLLLLAPPPHIAAGDVSDWPLVFRHLCESQHLPEVMIQHQLRAPWAMELVLDGWVCLLANYRFTEACLDVELGPTLSLIELHLHDGASPPIYLDSPPPLLRVEIIDGKLIMKTSDGRVVRHPCDTNVPLRLFIADGHVRVSESRNHIANIKLSAPKGVYVSLVTSQPGCWDCELHLLEIRLPPDAAERWGADLAAAKTKHVWVPAN